VSVAANLDAARCVSTAAPAVSVLYLAGTQQGVWTPPLDSEVQQAAKEHLLHQVSAW
jgi:hypothetical protein